MEAEELKKSGNLPEVRLGGKSDSISYTASEILFDSLGTGWVCASQKRKREKKSEPTTKPELKESAGEGLFFSRVLLIRIPFNNAALCRRPL